MSSRKINPEDFRATILESIRSTFDSQGLKKESEKPSNIIKESVKKVVEKLQEAIVTTPRNFLLKTERLSKGAKEAHFNLYRKYIESFNKISIELDSANRQDANSLHSNVRSLKEDEVYNLNGIKLHELYWANISDLKSEISVDSLPYMKLARDWGTFEKWQFDFISCALSARNGWAVTVYEPYKNIYMNVVIDSHNKNIPVGAIPVLVMDMWEHAYFRDYGDDKRSYLVSMMKELNWSVIEARMQVAEQSNLSTLYNIVPIVNDGPERLLANAENAQELPIDSVSGNTNPTTIAMDSVPQQSMMKP